MREYAKYRENEATQDGGRYQEAVNELDEITAERDNWLAEIDMLNIEQTPHMAFDTVEAIKELRQQMVDAVNDEYRPKIRECSARTAYFERMGA